MLNRTVRIIILQVLKELISEDDSVLDFLPNIFAESPRLSLARESVSVCSEEWHHTSHLIPSHNDLVVTGISIEARDITPKHWKAHNCSREHLMDSNLKMCPITSIRS